MFRGSVMRIASSAGFNKRMPGPAQGSAKKAEAERSTVERQAEEAMRSWNDYERQYGSVANEFGEL